MARKEKTSQEAKRPKPTKPLGPAEPAGFDPFSILPDNQAGAAVIAEPVAEYRPAPLAPARHTPAPSIAKRTELNGKNIPANLEQDLHRELEKRRAGRMSMFTPENAATVIEGIENGRTMDDIAADIGVQRQTIWTWMQLSPGFYDLVAQAREFQGHASASDAVKILDEVEIDPENPKAAMAELRKAEQRARIRMELAKCFNFRQYGDKKQNMNLNINAEVSPVDLSNYT